MTSDDTQWIHIACGVVIGSALVFMWQGWRLVHAVEDLRKEIKRVVE